MVFTIFNCFLWRKSKMNFRLASMKSLTNCEIPSSNTLLVVYPEQLGILKESSHWKSMAKDLHCSHDIDMLSPVLRIRDPVPFWPLDPGSGMGKKSGSGSGMNNPDHISESLETIFLGLKYLNSLMRIRDTGWKKIGSGIRDIDHIYDNHCKGTVHPALIV